MHVYVQTNSKAFHSPLFVLMQRGNITYNISQLISVKKASSSWWIHFPTRTILLLPFASRTRSVLLNFSHVSLQHHSLSTSSITSFVCFKTQLLVFSYLLCSFFLLCSPHPGMPQWFSGMQIFWLSMWLSSRALHSSKNSFQSSQLLYPSSTSL